MLIFLDFDGVLRRKTSPLYRLEAPLVACFEEALRAIPGAEVVISSSWRDAFSLAEMRRLFSPDVAERIAGVTPVSQDRDGFYRHREVLAYLKRNGHAGHRWIAIDDDPEHYPANSPVLLVDPARGFDADARARLLDTARQL